MTAHEVTDEQITEAAALATAGTSRIVAPNRKALAKVIDAATFTPDIHARILKHNGAEFTEGSGRLADALLADADLWQPASVIDRDALANIVGPALFGDYYPNLATSEVAMLDRALDALLASGWQPASKKQPDRVGEWFTASNGQSLYVKELTDAGPRLVVDGQEISPLNISAIREYSTIRSAPASPRTVTTVEELDALPVGSVIRNKSRVLERLDDRWYGTASNYATTRPLLPASVLYVPSEGVES